MPKAPETAYSSDLKRNHIAIPYLLVIAYENMLICFPWDREAGSWRD
jgi:hypothetical protein